MARPKPAQPAEIFLDVQVGGYQTHKSVFEEIARMLLYKEPVLREKFDTGEWVGISLQCEARIIKLFLDGFFVPTLIPHADFIREYGSRVNATKLKLKDSFRLDGHVRNLEIECPNDPIPD